MRATTQRGALLETLGKVKSAVMAKSTLPICSSILIRAGGGQVTLTGTDLEVSLTAACKATVTRQGAVAISPRLLEAFLKAVKAETVSLSLVDKNHLKIEAGVSTTLEGFEAKDFPSVPGVRGKPAVVTGLANGLKQISYAMAKEDTRPVLNGVCFTQVNGKIALAAADGFRLAETTVRAKGTLDKVIVPSKAVCLIQKLMPSKVSIHKGNETVAFVGEGLVLTAKAVLGQYPNYAQLIPKNGSPLTVDSMALKNVLDVVTVTLPNNNVVRLQTRGHNLIVSTKDAEKGETEAKISARGKAKIGFDMHFLKDLLAKASGPVTLRTTNAQSPGVVRQNGTIHLLMPMAVEW